MSNNRYYFMKESSGPEIGSNYPQSISTNGYALDCENGIYQLMKYDENLPDIEPHIGNIILASYAKLTDVISTAYFNQLTGKLLNQRALDVFLSYKMPSHKAYPVNVIYKGKSYPYYWLHLVSNDYTLINFDKSKYIKTSAIGKKVGDISIKSYADFLKERDQRYQGYSIKFESLYIYSNRIKLDLFSIGAYLWSFFASEQLLNAVRENKITGLSFMNLPQWIHFD